MSDKRCLVCVNGYKDTHMQCKLITGKPLYPNKVMDWLRSNPGVEPVDEGCPYFEHHKKLRPSNLQ